jgi:hypothetical protein
MAKPSKPPKKPQDKAEIGAGLISPAVKGHVVKRTEKSK